MREENVCPNVSELLLSQNRNVVSENTRGVRQYCPDFVEEDIDDFFSRYCQNCEYHNFEMRFWKVSRAFQLVRVALNESLGVY